MNDLLKVDMESLLQAICHYENGQANKVDGALVEVIADKYGFKFCVETVDDKDYLYIDSKEV